MSMKLAAYSHSAAHSQKIKVQKHFKKGNPRTKPNFLHVLEHPDHFGTIYTFNNFSYPLFGLFGFFNHFGQANFIYYFIYYCYCY